MEIIQELEREPRGVYTGAIGFFSTAREAVFSVPIRTVVPENNRGTMGIGSGIVIDSQAQEEFNECMLKAEFLTRREDPFELLEPYSRATVTFCCGDTWIGWDRRRSILNSNLTERA
jgi:para-aminobenzoate synthetase/4-amino-4-deoxychorismate lyase